MEDAHAALSQGMLARIANGEEIDGPVLQCLQIKPMNSNPGGVERYRVVMSDSVNFIQGMLAQQLNNLVHDATLKKGSICRLQQYQTNQVKEKLILVVLACEVLTSYGEHDKFGNPAALEGPTKQEPVQQQPGNIAGNGFYGAKPPQAPQQQHQQAPQRSLPSRTNGASGATGGTIHPIEALSPYAHKWSIKARCTSKSEIRTYHNSKGEGKLFSVNLLDESGEIKATGFNDAVDNFYELFQEGSVYYISSPAKIQLAKKQFSNLNNDYEITFENGTQVEKAEDGGDGVPQLRFNFTTIEGLQGVDKDATVDVIGVLRTVGETVERTSKTTGKPYNMRELTIADNSGFDIRLTVWGKTAESFSAPLESVVAFKGLKVSDFGGRSLSLLSSGTMTIDPDIDEAHKLKGWYDAAGREDTFQNHAGMSGAATMGGRKDDSKTIAQVSEEGLGLNEEKPDYFSLKATVVYIKSDTTWSYPACRTEGCNKKMVETGEGEWRCEKCDKNFDYPDHRYVLSINVSDYTGQMWLSCFNETGLQIMGMPAGDLVKMRDDGDDVAKNEAFTEANCKTFVFRVRAKMEVFSDQQKVRYQVQSASPIDFSRESKKLADLIKAYTLEENSMFVS